jgi:GxxExxY protein
MIENELAKVVVNTAYNIHNLYGPGLFESVYEEIMFYELDKEGLAVRRQVPIPLVHEHIKFEAGFRADIIIENKLLVELKSVEAIAPVHFKQVLTYLKLTQIQLGILINFNVVLIKDGIKRVANGIKDPLRSF